MAKTELVIKIQASLASGETEEKIRAQFKKEGFSDYDINGAFAAVKLQNLPLHKTTGPDWWTLPPASTSGKGSLLLNFLVVFILIGSVYAAYGLFKGVVATVTQAPVQTGTTTASITPLTKDPWAIIPATYIDAVLPPAPPAHIATSQSVVATLAQSVQTPVVAVDEQSNTPTTETTSETAPAPVVTVTPPIEAPSEPTAPTTPVVTVTPPLVALPPSEPSEPSVPSAPSGTYPVYPGCESPATSYDRTVYVDPINGSDTADGSQATPYKTLAHAFSNKVLQGGDHIVLLPGSYPKLAISNYTNGELATSTQWIWIDSQPGAVIYGGISIQGLSRWLITNPELTSTSTTPTTLMYTAGGSNVVIADGNIYTTKDSSAWTADDWINHSDSGIHGDNTTCMSVLRNHILNVRGGIAIATRGESPDPTAAVNSMKTLVEGNVVRNFSADGMDIIGSDMDVAYNSEFDEYVSQADGDANHDDGIQSWALGGAVYENMTFDHNWIQETTNINRPLIGPMQGISSFDGEIDNVKVTNNVIITSVWQAIAWYGDHNILIDHNTVANYTNNGRASWIMTHVGKTGLPPVNDTISNNTAVSVFGAASTTVLINNYNVTSPTTTYAVFDPADDEYDFSPKPGGPIDGKNAGADAARPSLSLANTAINKVQVAQVVAPKKTTPSTTILASAQVGAQKSSSWFVSFLESLWAMITSFFQRL